MGVSGAAETQLLAEMESLTLRISQLEEQRSRLQDGARQKLLDQEIAAHRQRLAQLKVHIRQRRHTPSS